MSNSREFFVPTFLPEQVRTGLSTTAKTLSYFGVQNPGVNESGRVKFVPEAKIVEVEEQNFLRENTILDLFGDDSEMLKEAVFRPSVYNTEDGQVILLRDNNMGDLVRKQGINIRDRQLVSDRQGALYELTASGVLGINSQNIPTQMVGAVEMLVDDFSAFLTEFTKSHHENDHASRLPTQFHNILNSSEGLNVKIKGVCVSLDSENSSLFTLNYTFDQAVRFVLAHKMFDKFHSLMNKKYTWFSPSERFLSGVALDNDMEGEMNDLLKMSDAQDPRKLVDAYVSGELGARYLEMTMGKAKIDLAGRLRQNMLGGGDSEHTDYSGYEVRESIDDKPQNVMEEDEEIILPVIKKRRRLLD